MPKRTCSVIESGVPCPKPAKIRGWCKIHYQRWYRTGDPLGIRPPRWEGYVKPICSVDGCDEIAHARGMCPSHRCRTRRHGDPRAGRRNNFVGTDEERFWSFVDVDEVAGCWLWNGGRFKAGYAEFNLPEVAGPTYGHRWSYEHFVGPIPEWADGLDHMCRVRHCVNPAHLDPVTHKTNMQRGVIARFYNVDTGRDPVRYGS